MNDFPTWNAYYCGIWSQNIFEDHGPGSDMNTVGDADCAQDLCTLTDIDIVSDNRGFLRVDS